VRAEGAPDPLRDLLARFPDSEGRARKLIRQEELFRELCADYAECLEVLRRLRERGSGQDIRIEQYTELRVNLEQEMLSCFLETSDVARGDVLGE
jgi:hypothetical protein